MEKGLDGDVAEPESDRQKAYDKGKQSFYLSIICI